MGDMGVGALMLAAALEMKKRKRDVKLFSS